MSETIKMDFYVCKRLIRECNAKDPQKAWKKFLREQKAKHGHKTIIRNAQERPEALDEGTTTHSV